MPRRVQVLRQRKCLRVGKRRGILIWVVRYEAEGHVAKSVDFDDVATDGSRWRVDRCSSVDASAHWGALYYLEVMAVYMERMTA